MSRIFITQSGAKVTVRDGAVVALVEGRTVGSWPIEQVRSVYCFGSVQLGTYGLGRMLDEGIRIELLSSTGRYRGSITDGHAEQLFLRMAHHDRWRDEGFRLRLTKSLIRHKLCQQRGLLQAGAKSQEPGFVQAARGITDALNRLEEARELESVMGYEGIGAKFYFGVFGQLLRKDIPFEGRSRRPPEDAPNALLSLGYTLLGTEIGGLLEAEGFDPMLGFLHGFRYGRQSLAQDLLEELRQPVIDRWVLNLFNRQRVTLEHFESRDGGVYLTKGAFKEVLKLYQAYLGRHGEGADWRERLVKRVDALKNAVLDGVELEGPDWQDGGW